MLDWWGRKGPGRTSTNLELFKQRKGKWNREAYSMAGIDIDQLRGRRGGSYWGAELARHMREKVAPALRHRVEASSSEWNALTSS